MRSAVRSGRSLRWIVLGALGALVTLLAITLAWRAFAPPGQGRAITTYPGPALRVAWSPDGSRVISSAPGSPIRATVVADGSKAAAEGTASLVALAATAHLLATASEESIVVRGLDDWQPRLTVSPTTRSVRGLEPEIKSLAISEDGSTIAARTHDGLVSVWRVADGSVIGAYGDIVSGTGSQVNGIALSRDGSRLVAIGRGGVRIWDLTSPEDALDLDQPTLPVQSVALSPDGQTVAVGLGIGVVRLSGLDGGAPRELRGHTAPVVALSFSADGALLATGAALGRERPDGSVRLWRIADGAPLATLSYSGQSTVNALAFSPDMKQVAGALDDGTVRLWSVP